MLSWLVAALPAADAASCGEPAAPRPSASMRSATAKEHARRPASVWPQLEAGERDALRATPPTGATAVAERARLRSGCATGRAIGFGTSAPARALPGLDELSAGERARLRAAQARLSAMAPAEQAALRAQFAALDADTQRVWWLGPSLGQQLAPVAPLFAFLPEADRPALLAALRGLEPAALAQLAQLAPRLDEAKRQDLRRQLLRLPPAERAGFISRELAASGALQ